ncbi:MAG: hypothetical protein J7501_18670 [Bdellovibrio sp.]|nr:hypothetical protein [Bdellovibrio sp.]
MKTLKLLFAVSILFASSLSFAAPRPGFTSVGIKEVKEDDVTFRWMSNDGEIILKCAHVYDRPDAWDWDVVCGKKEGMLKIYRVHFLVHQYVNKKQDKKAYEILYWVIDRNFEPRKFSSVSQWLQFNGTESTIDFLNFSVGVENDYGLLELELKPR